jgi:hypothetical protein
MTHYPVICHEIPSLILSISIPFPFDPANIFSMFVPYFCFVSPAPNYRICSNARAKLPRKDHSEIIIKKTCRLSYVAISLVDSVFSPPTPSFGEEGIGGGKFSKRSRRRAASSTDFTSSQMFRGWIGDRVRGGGQLTSSCRCLLDDGWWRCFLRSYRVRMYLIPDLVLMGRELSSKMNSISWLLMLTHSIVF